MAWIGYNWIWIAFFLGMGAIYLFGHRRHSHMLARDSGQEGNRPSEKAASTGRDRGLATAADGRKDLPVTAPKHRHWLDC